ncbi:23S rRNA (adenine(2030)-N(6))-methyltransferase RlmJ [Permianibacter sp. IMCC34836]|uniref:23S rRNA (adenine(2030)-N(6))-methyltransferase RlmJ n=1 Tax=Permianibacter fluminis TaxID=2738515 RepID=UPI001554B3DD|nr:23S rRNA (adenine(2030)-N(6))-methyltransferase RlmJ [Permianibacter fluminis]NQD36924.1 23S rRNA (adenine(2030)-N(6))-methyltransferase RlmJ [Permianibacter fluminis]
MNYRHGFHAGNVADVLKHTVLILLLEALKRKDKPFLVLDTHAGRGLYDLHSKTGRETGEWQQGIALLQDWPDAPIGVRDLQQLMLRLNKDRGQTDWRYYPGSPEIIARLLRPVDRAVCCELQSDEAKALQLVLEGRRRISVRNEDGYHALRAQLPPVEKRGLVLIDPPYENEADSWSAIVRALQEGYQRFATGTFALWYPIKAKIDARKLHEKMQRTGIRKIWYSELTVFNDVANVGLNGSGMLIINPPFQVPEQVDQMLLPLWKKMSPQQQGYCESGWLVGE